MSKEKKLAFGAHQKVHFKNTYVNVKNKMLIKRSLTATNSIRFTHSGSVKS